MSQSDRVKNKFHFEFLKDHEKNRFTGEDVAKVIAVMNPVRGRIDVETNLQQRNNKSYEIQPEISYKFPNEKLAKLFETTYKNLVQNGNVSTSPNALEVSFDKEDPTKVILKQKESTLESRISLRTENAMLLNENTIENIKLEEQNKIMSDIFTLTTASLLNSGIYDFNRDYSMVGEFQKRRFSDAEALEKANKSIHNIAELRQERDKSIEKREEGLPYESGTTLFNRLMVTLQNPYREDINKSIIKEIQTVSDKLLTNERAFALKTMLYRELKGNDVIDLSKNHRPELQKALQNEQGLIYQGDDEVGMVQKVLNYFKNEQESPKQEEKKKRKTGVGIKYK